MEQNKIFMPTIGQFELKGEIHVKNDRILRRLNERTISGEFVCKREDYEYKRVYGGLTIKLWRERSNDRVTITITNIDFPRLLYRKKKVTIADLSQEQVEQAEDNLLNILDRLDILRLDNQISWNISKIVLRRDFYTEESPRFLMKLLKYESDFRESVRPRTKREIKEWNEEQIPFGKDRGRHCLRNLELDTNVRAKAMGDATDEEIQAAQHRMQYAFMLDWKMLRELEMKKRSLWGIEKKLRKRYLSKYLTEVQQLLPDLISQEALWYFGKYPWGTVETVKDALKKLQNSSIPWFDNEAYRLVNQYLENVQTLEIPNVRQRLAQMGEYEKRKLERAFSQMGLSMIVIPDEILSPEEQQLFPCRNLAERVQQGK